jgi:aryl-alcohol dehydrogenase-like predicted oxidoreductase
MPSGACYDHDENRARLARASTLAREKGVTVPQILIAYLSALPCRVHPVCASRKRDHLRANRAALDFSLSLEEVRMLEGEVPATPGAVDAG